jgi:NtrC-family two-component system response regulator AlgB
MSDLSPTLPLLSVLVIDDEPGIRKALAACLEADGHEVVSVSNGRDAIASTTRKRFDLVFVDIQLGDHSGMDLIPGLLAESPWLKIVMITAFASIDTAVASIKLGASDYLPKPFTPAQVAVVTQKVQQLRALEQRVSGLEEAAGQSAAEIDLTSSSPAMERAIELARQVAPTDATVLLRGESGTGKGVLARAIHSWSKRSAKLFSIVSCPSLSQELLESELFGHVKGAFTGAVRDNPGRLAVSDGGTVLLDEIGDLPLGLQPKLLRFVQDREYERVGDHKTRRADVRILAATNVNLEDAMKAGKFREDLLYRIKVIEITLPPLRDRPDDVVRLSDRLLQQFAGRIGKSFSGFSDAARDALRSYSFPGNVRELRNVIERASILCHGDSVGPQHLMLTTKAPGSGGGPSPGIGDPIPLEQVEEQHIRAVLASTNSIDEAARVLGMDSVTLWRRRKKYGI